MPAGGGPEFGLAASSCRPCSKAVVALDTAAAAETSGGSQAAAGVEPQWAPRPRSIVAAGADDGSLQLLAVNADGSICPLAEVSTRRRRLPGVSGLLDGRCLTERCRWGGDITKEMYKAAGLTAGRCAEQGQVTPLGAADALM
jgi:hypothetical protein